MDERMVVTLIVFAVAIVFRLVLGGLFGRKLRQLVGHQLLLNTLTAIFSVALVIYLLNVWGIIQALLELLVAFSAITAVIFFAVKDIWISNILAGVSLIEDKHVKVGTEIEIGGKKERIFEMTLTKMNTEDGHMIIVPNKKFTEEVVVLSSDRR